MLKKAGIVVAAATAGLLAVSPLAFAGDYNGDDDDNGGRHHHSKSADCEQDNSTSNDGDNEQKGLVNIDDTTVQVPVQACGNDVLSGVLGILAKDLKNTSNDD